MKNEVSSTILKKRDHHSAEDSLFMVKSYFYVDHMQLFDSYSTEIHTGHIHKVSLPN